MKRKLCQTRYSALSALLCKLTEGHVVMFFLSMAIATGVKRNEITVELLIVKFDRK